MPNLNKTLEWGVAILSIAYSLLIASNTGFEVLSFILFLLAALLLFTLAVRKRMWGWTTMQAFYIAQVPMAFMHGVSDQDLF